MAPRVRHQQPLRSEILVVLWDIWLVNQKGISSHLSSTSDTEIDPLGYTGHYSSDSAPSSTPRCEYHQSACKSSRVSGRMRKRGGNDMVERGNGNDAPLPYDISIPWLVLDNDVHPPPPLPTMPFHLGSGVQTRTVL